MQSPEKTATKRYHHGALKENCLKTGLEVLIEHGVDKFSLREVARRLDVTPTALYHHFPDKKDLLAELARVGLNEFSLLLQKYLSNARSPEAILDLGREYIRFFEQKPYYLDILFLPGFAEYEEVVKARKGAFALLTQSLVNMGWSEVEAPSLGVWLWSSVHGLATMCKAGIFGYPRESCGAETPEVFTLTHLELWKKIEPALRTFLTSRC